MNCKFGNLNQEEAVKLTNDAKAKEIAIPCHFWTFIEHTNNHSNTFGMKLATL